MRWLMGIVKGWLTDPKNRLETLLVVCTVVVGYWYIYVYQNMLHVSVPLLDVKTLLKLSVMVIVVLPLIHVLVKSDPLQRSPSQRKAIRFFQAEFPSGYLLRRCKRCAESQKTCPNYITPESHDHIRYWFHDIFHGPIEAQHPETVRETFEKGYTCKLWYYLTWVLGLMTVLAILTVAVHHVCLYLFEQLVLEIHPLQVVFPLVCISVVIAIRFLNKVDEERPSGCWQAWRQVNRIHKGWLRQHENLLVSLICHAGQGTKRFKER